ncbi:MAG: hypothetical protein R2710_04020 [Acidimicrobiales bacterium]
MSDSPICPVLGSDITDLSAFGGSVAELLRHGLVHDDLQAPLIEHVLEGREPTTEQFAAINKRATSRSHSFVVEPRLVLAALLALPDEAIARMAPAVGIRSRPNLKNIIDLAIGVSTNRSATQKSTVDDIVACGERWGWNISDLAASIVVGEFSPGLPAMDGYERFVIDRPSELLAAAQQATTRTSLWRSLSQVSIEALGPFTGLAIDDALGRNEWTRESAHAIATRLPATLAIPTLTTLIETGSAIQRQRAAGVLRSIASSMPNPTRELLDWVECRVEQETAGRARAELELRPRRPRIALNPNHHTSGRRVHRSRPV